MGNDVESPALDTPVPASARPGRNYRWFVAGAVVVLVSLVGAGAWYISGRSDHANAGAAMANRAQQVMPFDLSRTTHTFAKTLTGGVETVVVKDPADARNRKLIRSHLQTEAANFRRGDYSDPGKIHGMNMPGVSTLEQGAARVTVEYADLPDGARVTYSSTESNLVTAIHDWFDRQVSDHSMPGMGG
jgi:hypothetical protein